VQVSGFNSRAIDRLAEGLAPYGLRVAAGAGGSEEKLRPPLVPGAALGARLIGGDLDMTALGTLTMIEGGQVLGFGHPLFQLGDVDLPMTGGYVYDILPSVYVSNKVMAPTQVVGRVYNDHQSAIAGRVGGKADTLPVRIEVEDADAGRTRVANVEVARLRELTPMLVASAVVTTVDEVRGRIARGMTRVKVEIETEGRKLVREEVDYDMSDAASSVAPAIMAPLAAFTENQFGRLRIDRLVVRVRTQEARRTAAIERVTIDRTRVKAGDTVTFAVTVRPYGSQPVQLPIKLSLPADLPQGRLRVVVCSGGEAEQARGSIGAPRPAPVSLEQVIARYLSDGQSTELVLQAALPRGGVSLLGEELPDLPRRGLEALGAMRPTDLKPSPSVMKIVTPTEWVLTGRQVIMLPVESPLAAAPGAPAPPPKEEPSEEPEEGGEEEEASVRLLPPAEAAARPLGTPVAETRAEAAEEKPEAGKAAPLSRAAQMWTQASGADYEEAKLSNLSLGTDGALGLGLEAAQPSPIPAEVVWSLAVREAAAYVGTGSEGKIYRVSPDGQVSEFLATGEMNVHALAFGAQGELYAGTSPNGKLFRISPSGESKLVFDSDSTYIWALALGSDGTLYAGGGSPGRIYAISASGETKVLAELPVANVLSLVVAKNGDVYAGASETGVVYRVQSDGTTTTVGRVPGASVDALAFDEEGNLFATSTPSGEVYRIAPGGSPQLYLETGQRTVFGLAMLGGAPVVSTGPKGLAMRATAARKAELMFRPESGLGTAIAADEGALYAATSGPSVLFRFGPAVAKSGSLESKVLDAERPAKWGRVTWAAEEPKGTTITADTRSGNSPQPGADWAPWMLAVEGSIASPPARYLQYRLALSTETPTGTPVVRQVSVSREPQNRPPVVRLGSPEAGARVSGKQAMKWQGRDPDRDTLVYDVKVSPDWGKTWSTVAEKLRDPKCDWDTKKQTDGRYLLTLTASDRLSAPGDPQTADTSAVVWVDNTAPTVLLFRASMVVSDDKRAQLTGLVTDALSPIRSVEYKVGSGEWQSLPVSAVESTVSDIAITTDPLTADTQVSVRAFDAAGNMASDEVEVKLPSAPATPAPEATAPAAETPSEKTAPEPPEGETVLGVS
jgi:hypothetical protein